MVSTPNPNPNPNPNPKIGIDGGINSEKYDVIQYQARQRQISSFASSEANEKVHALEATVAELRSRLARPTLVSMTGHDVAVETVQCAAARWSSNEPEHEMNALVRESLSYEDGIRGLSSLRESLSYEDGIRGLSSLRESLSYEDALGALVDIEVFLLT